MRLFVLGATGRTGSALVAQGLARGHEITTFGRSAFGGKTKSLRIVVGNPMHANDLAAVLPGNDVVLSALGTRGLGATSVLADGVRATIEAMRCAGVRRLVIVFFVASGFEYRVVPPICRAHISPAPRPRPARDGKAGHGEQP